jgi:acetylornithine deacetylase
MAMPAEASRIDEVLGLMDRLIAFETESSKSNLGLIEAVIQHCRSHAVPFSIAPSPGANKAALVATVGPMVDGGIVLSGHTDVVPVTGQAWNSDPFAMRRENGRLYGRGTCDMKGFVALILAMIPEFAAARLPVPVHIVLSYDEEITCLGSMDIIAQFGKNLPWPRAAIVGEPTEWQVADSHKSVCTYSLRVEGHEAHSAKPQLGAHAIAAACEIASEINRLSLRFEAEGDPSGRFDPPYSTVHVGLINGGTARNILAKRCDLLWEFRGLPAVPLDTAQRHIERYIAQTALPILNRFTDKGRITMDVEVEVPGLMAEPGSTAEAIAQHAARRNRTVSVSFATEGGRFQQAGIPTVICGPGSIDQAHQPDEFIAVAQVEEGIGFMRRLIEALR